MEVYRDCRGGVTRRGKRRGKKLQIQSIELRLRMGREK